MADQINSLEDLERRQPASKHVVTEEVMAPREPVRDDLGRSYATGKRKDAVARVWIKPGSGKVDRERQGNGQVLCSPGAANDLAPAL